MVTQGPVKEDAKGVVSMMGGVTIIMITESWKKRATSLQEIGYAGV